MSRDSDDTAIICGIAPETHLAQINKAIRLAGWQLYHVVMSNDFAFHVIAQSHQSARFHAQRMSETGNVKVIAVALIEKL